MPDFQKRLGDQAVGVYAADKPDQVVGEGALTAAARALLGQAIARFASDNHGQAMEIPGGAGIVDGWTLFHDVLATVGAALFIKLSSGGRASARPPAHHPPRPS
jgi:hypothetical protein